MVVRAVGWLVAGCVLRPLREMTSATREISAASLHRRLALSGPCDELRELADTIDGLLGRLEGAFDAQRRFVANASHELRTPLAAMRALLEMAMSDQAASVGGFREVCGQVLEGSGSGSRSSPRWATPTAPSSASRRVAAGGGLEVTVGFPAVPAELPADLVEAEPVI